jgi:two-component system LytT family response regulator
MNVLIVDDENGARNLLKNILSERSQDIHQLFEAENLLVAVDIIKSNKIDLVFLDVEMPNHRGTEILNFIPIEEVSFNLVFTTAYSEYALKAFDLNAIDYLLKPLRPSKVTEAFDKSKEKIESINISSRLEELKKSLQSNKFSKIGLPVAEGVRFVEIEQIVNLEADGMYTKIHMADNSIELISKPLKFFADMIENMELFYRPHRSHLINLKYIKQYVKKDGNYVVLENDFIVPVSKEKKSELIELISVIGYISFLHIICYKRYCFKFFVLQFNRAKC